MEDPPPSATWHPALRPETLDDASLYSPDWPTPRQETLSWDDVVARTPARSRAVTTNSREIQQTVPFVVKEETLAALDTREHTEQDQEQLSRNLKSKMEQNSSLDTDIHARKQAGQSSVMQPVHSNETLPLALTQKTHSKTEVFSLDDAGNPKMQRIQKSPANGDSFGDHKTENSWLDSAGIPQEIENTALTSWADDAGDVLLSAPEQPTENSNMNTQAEANPIERQPQSPLDLFPASQHDSGDIDEAWGRITTTHHTNSFPAVPLASTASTLIQPLAHSQAAAVIQEDDENLLSMYHNPAPAAEDLWTFSNNSFPEETAFFPQQEIPNSGPSSPPDDEARFEEGLPLVPQANAHQEPQVVSETTFDFGNVLNPGEDDFFTGTSPSQAQLNTFHAALERKSTEQVLNKLHLSHAIDTGSTTVRSPVVVESTNVASETTDTMMVEQGKMSGDADLAAAWGDALDDDLLDDTVDPSSFFGDEDDGFLLEDTTSTQPAEQQKTSTFSTPVQAPTAYIPQEFNVAAYHRNQSPFQTEPARPAVIQRAESYADKSKGGYASPYDAPMDLSRPRRAPAPRIAQIVSSRGTATPPPPRRNDSVQSSYAPSPTMGAPPPMTPTHQPSYSATGATSIATATPLSYSQAPNQNTSGFFEELPIVAKARPSSSAGRFMPQSTPVQQASLSTPYSQPLSQGAQGPIPYAPPPGPQQNFPQASAYQHMPSQQPSLASLQQTAPSRPIAPPTDQFGLVGPTKVMPFSEPLSASFPQAQNVSTAASTGRYSPSPQQQQEQRVPSHQGIRSVPPNPYANPSAATTIARPPSVPNQHVPPKPSPLRSASANQYRPGEQTTEPPSHIPRPNSAARRPSLLKNAMSLDELPSPGNQSQHNQSKITANGHLPDITQGLLTSSRDIRPSYESSRQISHLPPHQEVLTPGLLAAAPVTQATPFAPPQIIESYSVSQQAILTSANRVRAPSLLGQDNFMPPNDNTVEDPLQRWQGAPIFQFGPGGTVVTSFPSRIPRYSANSRLPVIKSNPGEVRIHTAKILPPNERIATFPGPLRNKAKKRELLSWLHNSIASLSKDHAKSAGQTLLGDAQKRDEEKIMLWRVLATLVEYDGTIDGNQQAIDAIRKVLSPETGTNKDQESATQPLLPAISSPDAGFKPSIAGSSAVDNLRQFLLLGDREKAVWHAVDQKLWGHAMLIASTMPRELWKQVVHEFVRNEVKTAGKNTESLAALYDVFAGNWEESVDELVPPSARAGLKLMNKNSNSGAMSSGLDGLNRWRETLNLILSNRTVEDAKAIIAMGQLLASYRRFEAAHICYIFAKIPGLFGGPDDPQSAVVLLGADHNQMPLSYAKDFDNVLLTEVFEFVNLVLPAVPSQAFALPHLQAFKFHHAEVLVELGLKDEAQQYCDVITSALKATTNRSPYYHARLATAVDDLGLRLRQASKDGAGSWISKPNVDKVSGFLSKAFSGFIAGDDGDVTTDTRADTQGPFARINGNTPEMISRTNSPAMGSYGQLAHGQFSNSAHTTTSNVNNSRYAPGASISADAAQAAPSLPQPAYGGHNYDLLPFMPSDPYASGQGQQQQGSQVPSAISSPPKPSRYSPSTAIQPLVPQSMPILQAENRASPVDSNGSSSRPGTGYDPQVPTSTLLLEPRSNPYQVLSPPVNNRYSPGPRSSSFEPAGAAYEPLSADYQPRSYAPSPSLDPHPLVRSESYQPLVPSYGENSIEDSQPTYQGLEQTVLDEHRPHDDIPSSEIEESMVVPTIKEPSYGYQPPSAGYEPPSYEPPAYDPEDTEDAKTPRKKKSFMDIDGEDDIATRAADLKKNKGKSAADKEAEDAFRRAAEADAKKDEQPKSGGGWFGGFFGKGKETKAPEPKAHKVHLGEENAFVYDETTKKWVNKKGGTEAAGPSTATPPPPKGPASRAVSAGHGPPAGARPPTSNPLSGPPNGIAGGAVSPGSATPPPISGGLPSGLAPPSRPATGMSGASVASSVDDLIGPAQSRKGGTIKKGKKGRGYVDVLANK